jgi:hypothetical protein
MEFTGGAASRQSTVLLEVWDTFGLPSVLQKIERYSQVYAGNNAFFPATLASGFTANMQDGLNVRRTAIAGAAYNGGISGVSVYGAPLSQNLANRQPAEGGRALRRYTFAVTVLMNTTDPNAFVEVGLKTDASRAETTGTTWGVMAALRGASTWQGAYKLASGGAFVTGAVSGLAPTVPRRITLIYEESTSNPGIFVKVGNQTILTLQGQANMPTVANGASLFGFGPTIGGYSVGAPGATVNVDAYDALWRVEELG